MINVFITDDHVLVREGLKKLLRDELDMRVVGEAKCAADVICRLGEVEPDVLVLDLALPDRTGLEVLKEVKNRFPKIRVLVLSMFPEDRFALRTLKAGADGYLTKDSAAEELVMALRKVAAGMKYVSQAISKKLVETMQDGGGDVPHEALSDREFQIFRMIGAGKTVSEIAAELNLSVSTVNTHRTHILEKMGMHSNAELMHYAIENKLVE